MSFDGDERRGLGRNRKRRLDRKWLQRGLLGGERLDKWRLVTVPFSRDNFRLLLRDVE
jgi:hypothetical protein